LKHERATEEVRELAALYALGSLTQHEARSFELHVQEGCSVCESEIRKFERTVAGIGFSAEEVEPPGYIRDLLLARVEREPQAAAATTVSEQKDEEEPPKVTRTPPPAAPAFSYQSGREKPGFIPWILTAALAVAAILAIYAWKSAQGANVQLQAKLSAAKTDSDNLQILYDVQKDKAQTLEQMLAILSKPGTRIARLIGRPAAPSAAGEILWDVEQNLCLLFGAFPPAPPGKIYQLWFVSPAAKVLVESVKLDPAGRSFFVVPVPKNAAGAIEALVTLEPDNGSQIPTTPYCAIGRFN
jgi:anti-sigma-K factor RskA